MKDLTTGRVYGWAGSYLDVEGKVAIGGSGLVGHFRHRIPYHISVQFSAESSAAAEHALINQQPAAS